jgi:nicotinamidase-related amidase
MANLHFEGLIQPQIEEERVGNSIEIKPRYYRWHVDPGVEWIEKNTGYTNLEWDIPLSQVALVGVDVWDRHYIKDTEARGEQVVQDKILPLIAACRKGGLEIIHAPSPGRNLAQGNPAYVNLVTREEVDAGKDHEWPPSDFKGKSGEFASYARPVEPRDKERADRVADLVMHPEVQPEGDEVVVAFGEDLHRYCKQKGILFLIYMGFNTNACILLRDYGTLEMSKRGYEIIMVRDCTTGMESFETHDELWQTRGAVTILEMFGKYSITTDELITALQ